MADRIKRSFTLNKTEEHIHSTGAFALKPSPEIDARVREFLNQQLAQYEADSQRLFITTVHSAVNPVVTFSQDLNALGNDTLEWGEVQSHDSEVTGCFSEHGRYEETLRVSRPSIREVEGLMQKLLDHAKADWSN
ncbi:hypothetical protein Pfra02_12880 [Pseudomonas fragi]|nr:hypothetical protein Pfra02_12880 [Pseudomonas fragi]